MINLIPNEEKKKMTRDFYSRLVILLLFMLSIIAFVASVVLLPSYFLSSVYMHSVKQKLDSQQKEIIPLPDQTILFSADELKSKLSKIESIQKDKVLFSERIINPLLLKKPSNIKITSIYYQINEKSEESINVNGLAESREALISFRRLLEDSPAFKKVDLPISNFVKGSNIEFSLSLISS